MEGHAGVLQGFEPTGVFARDVAECLKLQLIERRRFDPAMETLLAHLDLLARRDAALRRVCGVDEDDLSEMVAGTAWPHPRPGAAFGVVQQSIVPDAFVREAGGGGWRVELNSDTLPRLLVDLAITPGSRPRPGAKETSSSPVLAWPAGWSRLDQRAKTILKVASEIVRQQDAFLAFGVAHLRPLNLKTVADAIRDARVDGQSGYLQRYLATPRGVFQE